jgi:hypothetical protein
MAINSQKLLPQAKLTSTKVNVENKNVLLKKELINIRKTLINIDKLLLSNSLFKRKETELKRKDTEKQKFKEKETKLEKKKENEITKNNEPSVPQLGIFDRINRFITFTFLGFLFNKFSKYLPKILEFIKKIQPVAQFIESFIGNVFNGIVNFIDFGYSASKKVSNFAKQIGGENFQKTFDEFSGNLTKFINLAIVVGMATMGGTDFGLGKKGGKPGLGSNSFQKSTAAEQAKNARIRSIQKKYGPNARKIYENALNNGKTPQQAEAAIKRGLKKGVSIRPGADSLAARTAKKGSLFKGGLGKAPGRIATRVLGKTGSKLAGKVFGRIPIIGGLVSFIISVLSGEPVGRAAAKGVGATIGSALGTFIPIPFAGTILGGILGDIVGGALYDTIVGSRPERKKVQGRNRGGPITRGRRKVSGVVKRTVRVTKSPPKVPQVKPGESIGGKKNLQKIFPEPVGQQKGKSVNPYGFLTDTANSFLKTDIAGALGSVFIKPFLGQLPTKQDYKNFGLAMNIWISNAMSKGLIGGNATGGFADGGIINNGMMGDISKWAEKSIEEMIKNKVTDAINDLRKNLGLKPLQENVTGRDVTDTGGELGSASDAVGGARLLMAAGFPMLAAAILAGNIQTESAWKGQRTPWVLNDGGGTNKGLISWTSNSGRIANAEKFLGKPLETASNAEQIKWIKEELRQYGLLDEFMDPNRTEDQLKSDSYKYIGWGKEGDRWKQSARIFAALQKGEQGTYQPPSIQGSVSVGDGKFIQGNSGNSGGIHFHIGPGTQPGQVDMRHEASARESAFKVVKYFLGKKSLYHGRSNAYYSGNEDDATIRKMIEREQIIHTRDGSDGGIDIQVGGGYWPGAKVAFPFAVSDMAYRSGGFGVSAKINGFNAFVAHGAYDEKGRKAKQDRFNAYKDGGSVGFDKKSKNIGPLQNFPSYDQGSTFAILPIETIRTVPIQSPSQNKISFTGGGGGVNSNGTNKSRMFVG